MKKNIYFKFLLGLLFLTAFIFPFVSNAQLKKAEDNLKTLGSKTQYSTNVTNVTLATQIGTLINAAFGFLGILFFIFILWGGAEWMMSHGDTKKIGDAKARIVNAAIGLAIILMSYAIFNFIMEIFKKI